MTSKTFTSGTVIDSAWLNDVNRKTYGPPQSSDSSLVGFIQSGTGAIARTVQDKARESVSVLDFGADPTGVADSTTAIAAAITYAKSLGGGTVLFPTGTYLCATQLTMGVAQGVRLLGMGSNNQLTGGSTIKYTGTATPFMSVSGAAASLTLENLNIIYTSGSFTGTLLAFPSNGVAIKNCAITGSGSSTAQYLLDLNNSIYVDIDHTYFGNSQYAISGQKSDGTGFCNGATIKACSFNGLTVGTIRNPGQSWVITGCDIETLVNLTGSAVVMDAACQAYGTVISGCWMGDATVNSAWTWITWQGYGLSITGNYINGVGAPTLPTGIKILGTSYGITITSNYIAAFLNGVDLGSFLSSGTSISGNHFNSCTNNIVGSVVADHFSYRSGTYTPVPTNLTVVLGGGTVTYAGYYEKRGTWVTCTVVVSTTGAATTSSSASATNFTLPFPQASGTGSYGTCTAASPNTTLSIGQGYVGSAIFPPGWAATSNVIVIQGTYQTTTL